MSRKIIGKTPEIIEIKPGSREHNEIKEMIGLSIKDGQANQIKDKIKRKTNKKMAKTKINKRISDILKNELNDYKTSFNEGLN